MNQLVLKMNENSQDLTALVLRLSLGLSMLLGHGWGKFSRVLSGDMGFADPLGMGQEVTLIVAVIAEFFAAVLVVVGWKARWASVPVVVTMLVAFFIVEAGLPFGERELPYLYLIGYLGIFLLDSGKYSLDALTSKK